MDSNQKTGLIYNLQRFAVHDGPGIRTLVYMKGCPLNCSWCSSPQTQKPAPEIMYISSHCKECGLCVEICSQGAVSLSGTQGVRIDRDRCIADGQCVEACPHQARELAGKTVTVEELFKEVNKDSAFYRRSNGGVTVGGGEATMQHEFVLSFLKRCKKQYLHTVMETCGFVKWEHLKELVEYLDLVYFDIKHMNPLNHRKITGAANHLILENARNVAALCPIILRIPVVPGLNDSDENIRATAKFALELGENMQRIELLPYHKFGTQTYDQLGRTYKLEDLESPDEDHMERLKEIIESSGVKAQIGG